MAAARTNLATRRALKPVALPGVAGALTGFTPTKQVSILRKSSGLVESGVLAPEAARVIAVLNRVLADPRTRERAERVNAALDNDFAKGLALGQECRAETRMTAAEIEASPLAFLECAERKLGLTGRTDADRGAMVYLGWGMAIGLGLMLLRRRK